MSALQPVETAGLAPAELDLRFRRPLMGYFLNRVGDRAEAEDLTQQTFLRLLGGDRSEVANPGAFVFRVAANLLKDRARELVQGADRAVSFDDESAAPLAPADHLTPERVLLGRENLALLIEGLDELGGATRDAFVLFRFEHLSQKEIAARIGLSQGAVEKRLMRATLHLARKLSAVQ
jgi:RNA polymerase sigma-70 factor (ECF subfamily)